MTNSTEPNAQAKRESKPKAPAMQLPSFAEEQKKPFVPPAKRKRRSPIWLLFFFVILIAAAGIFILYPNDLYPSVRAALPLPDFFPAAASATATHNPTATVEASTATATLISLPTDTPIVELSSTPTEVVSATGGGPGQIAFASDRSGIPQIYLSDLAGLSVTPITNMPGGACQPSWSPDGAQLVFVSPCERPLDLSEPLPKDTMLYLVNADGSEPTALPIEAGGDSEPAWSPDGTRIAFTSVRDGQPLIYVVNLAERTLTRLTDASTDFLAARQPSWSPFGNQLLFAKKRVGAYQIWSVTDAGQGQQQLIHSGQQYWDYRPVWSPDGKMVSFSERNSEGPVLPWVMTIAYENRNTAAASQIRIRPLPIENLHYSPDGQWLVFEGKSPNNNLDVFYSTVTGDQRTRLTTDPGLDFDPAWRP